jgi:hypothetical protein
VLEQAKKQNIEISAVSEISLLRCTISDFRKGSESRNPRTEEVFQVLEGKIPWLVSQEGAPFEVGFPSFSFDGVIHKSYRSNAFGKSFLHAPCSYLILPLCPTRRLQLTGKTSTGDMRPRYRPLLLLWCNRFRPSPHPFPNPPRKNTAHSSMPYSR